MSEQVSTASAREASADPFDWLDEWLAAGEGRSYSVGRGELAVIDDGSPTGFGLVLVWTVCLMGPNRFAGGLGIARGRVAGKQTIRPETACASGRDGRPASQAATVAAALDMWAKLYGRSKS